MYPRTLSRCLIALGLIALAAACGSATAQVGAPPRAVGAAPERVRYDGQSVVAVDVSKAARLQQVLALTDDVWTHDYPMEPRDGAGWIEVRLTAEALAAVVELGIPHRVVIADLQGLVDAERARLDAGHNVAAGWYDDFKTWDEVNQRLEQLAAARPDLAKVEVAGQSLEGRDIRVIRITGPGGLGERPAFYIEGCQHAREWITPMAVMYIAEQLISGYDTDPRTRMVLDQCEFLIVPVVNADGYVYTWTTDRFWRKNRRNNGGGSFGVDLNRNWGYGWGGEGSSGDKNDDTYRGTGPFSEPESQVMRDYFLANPRTALAIDFHSYGQLILSPWGYTDELPPDAALFDELNLLLQSAIASIHGLVYRAGPTYTNIYPAAGVMQDWTYGDRGVLSWGMELRPADGGGGGFAPPPSEILPTAEENFEGVVQLALEGMRSLHVSLPSPLPSSIEPGQPLVFDALVEPGTQDVAPGTVMVNWNVDGGPFTADPMADQGGGVFRATVPVSCGQVLGIFVSAQAEGGEVVTYPAAGEAGAIPVAVESVVVVHDDSCESNAGWTVGAPGDDADTGIWELADPEATAAQPGDDHTPDGTRCWVTNGKAGNGIGANDVDGGSTSLTTPAMNALGDGGLSNPEARLSYWRWYSNDRGASPNTDSMPVLISNDDGQTWKDLEMVTENAGAWVLKEFRIADFVEPSAMIRLRFVARDLGDGSIVEAGVDDVRVSIVGCPEVEDCYADLDGNGTLDLFDFLAFTNLFNAEDAGADCDGDGELSLFDFLCFTNAFNAGC